MTTTTPHIDHAATSAGRGHAPAVSVHELRRRYGGRSGFEAVRGASFEVGHGELFALLGTNGAGKTSTLEVAEGLAPPSGGQVTILGADPLRQRKLIRPRLGIMLQHGGFPSELTTAEMARLWAGTQSHPRPVDEVLDMVALGHRRDVRVGSLSGGERRRLDLALALMNRPEVLFLDEPTTGLDPESRRNTWTLIRRLTEDGTAVVLTTHYLEEAEELADRLAIMHEGTIVSAGTPAEIAAGFPSTIAFELAADAPSLPDWPGLRVEQTVPRVVLQTDDLQPALTALLSWAEREQVVLRGLQARTASLEQAFLAVADSRGDDHTTEGATR